MNITKITTLASALLLISACSQYPMRLTQQNYSEKPIIIKENSSDALKLLSAQGAYTARDLTKDEFEDVEDDVEEYKKINQIFETSSDSGIAYAVGSTAIGTSLGLSLDFAGGLGLAGLLSNLGSAGYEGENYSFAWDYSSKHFLMNKNGKIDIELLKATTESVVGDYSALMPDIYKVVITESPGLEKREYKWIPKTDVSYGRFIKFNRNDNSGRKGTVSITFQCPVKGELAGGFCTASFAIRSVNDRYTLANAMREDFMRRLGPDYAVYIPPNTAYKNVPSVLHGDGKIEYLVEKGE